MNDRPRIAPSLAPRDEPDLLVARLRDIEAPPQPPRSIIGRIFLWLFLLLLLISLIPPAGVLWLRGHAPPTTAFMIQSQVHPVQYFWVPAQRIPEALKLAVIASEDQKFRTHWGFDFYAIAEALEHNENSNRKRGASTLTQQTAKNLFLWPSRSWLRKGLEVSFTLLLEGELSKDRILELYLNIAEFGPGIFGVEAAARNFFDKSADQLSPVECAELAAVLPNPTQWHANRPGPYVQSRVDWILVNIGQSPHFSTAVPPQEEPQGPAEMLAPSEPASPDASEPVAPATPEPAPVEPAAPTAPSGEASPATEPLPQAPAQSPQPHHP